MTPEHKAKLKAARAASQKGNGSNERIAACSLSDEQAQTLRRCPEKYKSAFLKAFAGGSKAAAIKAKCLECSNFNRAEVSDCLAHGCALWPYRPYQGGKCSE